VELKIRKAMLSDYPIILEYDEFPGDRRIDMERGELLIADCGLDKAVGYLRVTSNEFFNKPLIAILNTRPNFRSLGIATELIKAAIVNSTWHKVYSTTEETNGSMQSLFSKLGFQQVAAMKEFNFDGSTELLYCYTCR
jgi:RimJ/RimL family protein N-acetyltransferase